MQMMGRLQCLLSWLTCKTKGQKVILSMQCAQFCVIKQLLGTDTMILTMSLPQEACQNNMQLVTLILQHCLDAGIFNGHCQCSR